MAGLVVGTSIQVLCHFNICQLLTSQSLSYNVTNTAHFLVLFYSGWNHGQTPYLKGTKNMEFSLSETVNTSAESPVLNWVTCAPVKEMKAWQAVWEGVLGYVENTGSTIRWGRRSVCPQATYLTSLNFCILSSEGRVEINALYDPVPTVTLQIHLHLWWLLTNI